MSKKYVNYSKMATEESPVEQSAVEPVADTVDDVAVVTAIGKVVGCDKLNVRSKPGTDGTIVGVIEKGSVVTIDEDQSTDEWYKVCTTIPAEGFCMKKFIEVEPL